MTTDTAELAVDVRGLRKRYGDVTAVDGLDLRIRTGEVFGLLGPNGAGKSTTVEILQGNRARDGGDVTVLGADPGSAGRGRRSRVGIVWQDESAPAELTVRETVRHFAGYYPTPRDPDRVIELVGLEKKANARIKSLSGGQRRRLDVALGVIGDPELLLLDEPTTGFDPAARRRFWELIRMLADEGTTILLTTHYLEEAEALARRLAVIASGRVVAEGTPAELRARYGTRATVEWTEADGTPRSERTDTPTRAVAELTYRFDGEIPGLRISRPTLEDVYLRLTGQDRQDRHSQETQR
ncbi:ATP-binding cassette domain-containing protein [Streptomyces sp. SID8379]|uniref:ABC transporter ATP-binding protein n=1 Tax=unclassified Streptomyces TaxID=2593676 RepID=UPI000379EFA7|nr:MULTISPECIES: ABC transporter ATP-binding protein [unclassified Streptomyces]MYW65022.1 ATP-binding cassette domain-containing protein [Streptomyces sp. SID8379]